MRKFIFWKNVLQLSQYILSIKTWYAVTKVPHDLTLGLNLKYRIELSFEKPIEW